MALSFIKISLHSFSPIMEELGEVNDSEYITYFITSFDFDLKISKSIYNFCRDLKKKKEVREFPGGKVGKISTFNAGSASSIPSWGIKIPHAL